MADELDPRLEARLRDVLRREAGTLPFTLTAADVETARWRRRTGVRLAVPLSVLAAAAAIAVLVVATSAWWASPQVGTQTASPNPLAAGLESYEQLASRIAIIDGQVIARGEDVVGAWAGETVVGSVPANSYLDYVIDCRGGDIQVGIRLGTVTQGVGGFTCSDHPVAISGPGFPVDGAEVTVATGPGTVWRMVVGGTSAGASAIADPTRLPTFDELASVATSTHEVAREEQVTPDGSQGTSAFHFLALYDLWNLEVAAACLGPGQIGVTTSGTSDAESMATLACDGTASSTMLALLDNADERAPDASLVIEWPQGVTWRLIVYDRSQDATVLASYEELEALLAGVSTMPEIARGEHPDTEAGSDPITTDLGPVAGIAMEAFAYSCLGGDFEIDKVAGGTVLWGFGGRCTGDPHLVSDSTGNVDPDARLVVTADPGTTWRVVASGAPLAGGAPTSAPPTGAPSLPSVAKGSSELVAMDITKADGQVVREATTPDGTDQYLLHASCSGSGTLVLSVDGVEGSWDCGAIDTEVFAPSGQGDGVYVVGTVTGDARFLLRLDAVDLDSTPGVTFRPPALTLRGSGTLTGGLEATTAFAGCGVSLERTGGGGFAEDCGPSWQPVPDQLAQAKGGTVTISLADGWAITKVDGAIARDNTILASGRAPEEQPLAVTSGRNGWTFDAPPLGVWGVRLWVTATKDGETMHVPYYAGVYVAK